VQGISGIWTLPIGLLEEAQYGAGRVTNFEQPKQVQDQRYPSKLLEVWTFRVQYVDELGNLQPLLPVVIRAETISGTLRDGDEVEILGKMEHGILYAQRVNNKHVLAELVIKNNAGPP
jgi:hypothetical protein